jgi:hypothetical protein
MADMFMCARGDTRCAVIEQYAAVPASQISFTRPARIPNLRRKNQSGKKRWLFFCVDFLPTVSVADKMCPVRSGRPKLLPTATVAGDVERQRLLLLLQKKEEKPMPRIVQSA